MARAWDRPAGSWCSVSLREMQPSPPSQTGTLRLAERQEFRGRSLSTHLCTPAAHGGRGDVGEAENLTTGPPRRLPPLPPGA